MTGVKNIARGLQQGNKQQKLNSDGSLYETKKRDLLFCLAREAGSRLSIVICENVQSDFSSLLDIWREYLRATGSIFQKVY